MMKYFLNHLQNESGVALVTGLVIMVLLTAIGTYAIHMTEIDETISGNLKTSKQAFYVAEAGLQHAKTFLNQNKGNWSTYAYATLDDAKLHPLIPTTQLSTMGTYTVTIQDAGGGARRTLSTSKTASNASAVIENLVRIGPFTPGSALTVGGDLTINGNPTIAGSEGGVHANGNLIISGEATTISGGATATGTCVSPCIQGQPAATIPTINPADFFGARDYKLDADGKVYDKNGALVHNTATDGKWQGWGYSGETWTLSGSTKFDATLYIVGTAAISGSPGSDADPWITTIIATESIEVTGSPVMRPPESSDPGSLYRSGTENLLFVAGKDLKINGNPQQGFQGILAAHEQVRVTGNATLTGFIIAEDATHAGTLVTEDAISGNMVLIYDGNLDNPFPGDVQVMSWELGS